MTSIDYTLCDRSDRPILSIEFDGLGEGFSRDGVYVPRYTLAKDPNREWKLNFKLKVCESAWYPMFIVSFEEARQLGSELSLSVLDGIIGHCLGGLHTQERVNELADEQREILNNWGGDDSSLDEFVSDLILEAEVASQMAWNPVRRKIHEFQDVLMRHEGKLSWRESTSPRALVAQASDEEPIARQVTVTTSRGEVTEEAQIRTVPDWLTASIVADEIAQLLAFQKAVGLFDNPLSQTA